MVWDGNCGFCAYWVARWQKLTGDTIEYKPYNEAAENFPDINIHYFKEACQLIQTDGRVLSGPGAAYKTLEYAGKWKFLARWYERYSWFTRLNDCIYDYIAKHRSAFFRITKLMFGSNPNEVRPFWAIYLIILLYIIYEL